MLEYKTSFGSSEVFPSNRKSSKKRKSRQTKKTLQQKAAYLVQPLHLIPALGAFTHNTPLARDVDAFASRMNAILALIIIVKLESIWKLGNSSFWKFEDLKGSSGVSAVGINARYNTKHLY